MLHFLWIHMDGIYREIVDWQVKWIASVACCN